MKKQDLKEIEDQLKEINKKEKIGFEFYPIQGVFEVIAGEIAEEIKRECIEDKESNIKKLISTLKIYLNLFELKWTLNFLNSNDNLDKAVKILDTKNRKYLEQFREYSKLQEKSFIILKDILFSEMLEKLLKGYYKNKK